MERRPWPTKKRSEDNLTKWRHNRCLRDVTIPQPTEAVINIIPLPGQLVKHQVEFTATPGQSRD